MLVSVDLDSIFVDGQSFLDCTSCFTMIVHRPFNMTNSIYLIRCNVSKVVYLVSQEFYSENKIIFPEPIIEFPLGYPYSTFMGFSVKFHNISQLDDPKNNEKAVITVSIVSGFALIAFAFITVYLIMRRNNKRLQDRIALSIRLVDDFG